MTNAATRPGEATGRGPSTDRNAEGLPLRDGSYISIERNTGMVVP